jgi:23S rRNA pseudouridine2605 synthase
MKKKETGKNFFSKENQGDRPSRDAKPKRAYTPRSESFDKDSKPKREYTPRSESTFRKDSTGFDKDSKPKRAYTPRSDSFDKDSKPKREYTPRSESSFRKDNTGFDKDSKPKRAYTPRSESFDKDSKPKREYTPRSESSFRKDNTGFDKDNKPKRSYTPSDDKPKRVYTPRTDKYEKNDGSVDRAPKREYKPRTNSFDKKEGGFRKETKNPFPSSFGKFEKRPTKNDSEENSERGNKRSFSSGSSKFGKRENIGERVFGENKRSFGSKSEFKGKKTYGDEKIERKPIVKTTPNIEGDIKKLQKNTEEDGDMRLNKYLAHCGVASRRGCAELITNKLVTVNDVEVTEIGYRVLPTDIVKYKGKEVKKIEKMIYLLMNKPKDYITTMSDEKGRKTVMDLLKNKIEDRVFPIGRLDRNTTGLLLLTNDGELSKKLSHPSYKVKKIYHVVLDKPLTKFDFDKIKGGLTLEDGIAIVDGLDYVAGKSKNEVGIEIHIGKNRIVRRIFEHLEYDVVKLDRVIYGGLTKKDLPRGFIRHLTEKEVINLKHF